MRKLLTLAIPLLLGVGLLTAAIHHDPESSPQATRTQPGAAATASLPAVIEEAAAAATTTTTAAPTTTTTAAPAATTTTAAPTTTTTAPRPTTSTTTRPKPATTTTTAPPQAQAASPQPQVIDCGTGSANAKAHLVQPASGRFALTATVTNETTRAIELDGLVVTADYGAAGKKQFTVNVAGKRVDARPGQAEVTFSIPESEGTAAPSNFVISDFRFHTAGLPECASH